jgi:hypothetical protein
MATQPNGNSESIKKASNSFSQKTVLTVGYIAVSVVSAVMVARIILGVLRPRRLASEDYCVFVASAFFVSQCALYITIAPVSDRVMAVQEGRAPYYSGTDSGGLSAGETVLSGVDHFLGHLMASEVWPAVLIQEAHGGSTGILQQDLVVHCCLLRNRKCTTPLRNRPGKFRMLTSSSRLK